MPPRERDHSYLAYSTSSNDVVAAAAANTSTTNTSANSILPRMLAGSVGSIVTALAVTPLEVVKIRQQTAVSSTSHSSSKFVRPCPSCGSFVLNNGLMECVVPRQSVLPHGENAPRALMGTTASTGTFGTMRQIFVKEGFGGIYAGLSPTLVMSVPSTVLYFTSYDELVTRLRRSQGDRFWIPLASGSLARLLASVATAPLELIRTRQAMLGAASGRNSLVKDLRDLVKYEGSPALFKGLAPTLWRDVPFSAIYWFCLERFKLEWSARNGDDAPVSPLQYAGQSFLSGAAGGMIAAACTTPFDVVKTRKQVQPTVPFPSSSAEEIVCRHNGAVAAPSSTMGIMRQVVEEEGIAGLWRGNTTRIIKIAPACAIMISCYEVGKLLLLS